jgi:hypothetical protein
MSPPTEERSGSDDTRMSGGESGEATVPREGQGPDCRSSGSELPAVSRLLAQSMPAFGVYRFELTALEELRLPGYPGSAFRGLLGHGLKRTVCVTRLPRCEGCLLEATCPYPLLFETPGVAVGEGRARFANAPHPFVLRADWGGPRQLGEGEGFEVGITLFGRVNSLLPYVVHAMDVAGARGVGRGRGKFEVEALWQEHPAPGEWAAIYTAAGGRLAQLDARIPAVPEPLMEAHIELVTPLRLKRLGRLVGPAELDTRQFLTALVRRLESLSQYYGRPFEPPHHAWIAEVASNIELVSRELRWADWTRYSSRQHTRMEMGGLIGRVTLRGSGLGAAWPLVFLGQWAHVGKGTSMGLGQYRLG